MRVFSLLVALISRREVFAFGQSDFMSRFQMKPRRKVHDMHGFNALFRIETASEANRDEKESIS